MYKTKSHSKFNLLVHLIFVAKFRYKWLTDKRISDKVKRLIIETAEKNDLEIIEIETDKDHVHLLVSYHPMISINEIVHKLKQKVAYTLWKEDEIYMRRFYYPPRRLTFSRGYFACSIGMGASYDTIREYINNQG